MKKILCVIMFLLSGLLYAKELKVKTGDVFGFGVTDYFFPLGISVRGSRGTVTNIQKIDNDLWSFRIAVCLNSSQNPYPVQFDYYVKTGSELSFYRMPNFSNEIKLKVKAVNWNEITFEITE